RALLAGNAYYRRYRNENLSSNVNEAYGASDDDGAITSEAINSRSRTDQRSYGAGVQLTLSDPVLGHENQFVLGAGADGGDTGFRQAQQAARFSADRGTPGVGEFAATTDVATTNRYLGLYLSDSLHLSRR